MYSEFEFFEVYVGLMQREVISPVLFSLFLEDLELYLQTSDLSGLSLQDITLILLPLADDMVIFGHDQYDLIARTCCANTTSDGALRYVSVRQRV